MVSQVHKALTDIIKLENIADEFVSNSQHRTKKTLIATNKFCPLQLSNAYNVLMLYPFLPFMTKFFLPGKDTAALSNYAGIVVASYFGGRIMGSYIWGSLADIVGRKTVLAANCLMMSGTLLITAFSINYGMVVALRCILGLCNGVIVVLRAVISESSTNTNQAFGFSVLSFSWMTAAVFAPLFSGLSADPIGQYNLTLSNGTLKTYLTTFPYALPFILNMLVCIAGALAVIFVLPETLHKVSSVGPVRELESDAQDISPQEMTLDHSDEALLQSDTANQNTELEQGSTCTIKISEEKLQWLRWRAGCCKRKCRPTLFGNGTRFKHWCKNMKSILRNRIFLIAVSAQCLLAVIESSSDSVYALWFATPLNLGGIGFALRDIGISSTVIAAIYFPFSLPVYPLLYNHQRCIDKCSRLSCYERVAAVWVVIICCRTLMTVTFSTCFAAQSLFIGNSVIPDQLGTANGLALLMSDIIRCVSPALFGAIYAASLSEQTLAIGFPVDYNIVFILYGVVLLALVIVQACLPLSIDTRCGRGRTVDENSSATRGRF
eukprot:Em0017g452a